MRAGPLSSPRIIDLLNDSFINVWVLAKDLEPLARQASSPEVRDWLARLQADYTYPVDSIVYAPDGRRLVSVPANELIGHRHAEYLRFLIRGLNRARQ